MINITVAGVQYPVPSSAADTNEAAKQIAFEQALATATTNIRTDLTELQDDVNVVETKTAEISQAGGTTTVNGTLDVNGPVQATEGYRQTIGDSTSTPGNATLNTPAGVSTFNGAQTKLTITNSLCTTSCLLFAQLKNDDLTESITLCKPNNGSFDIWRDAGGSNNDVMWQLVFPA